jgi:hypothetical protein
VHRSDPERWRNPLNCTDPQQSTRQLMLTLWENTSVQFRYYAVHLLQARIEDDQPYPTSRTHPLYQSFTSLLDARTAEYEHSGK